MQELEFVPDKWHEKMQNNTLQRHIDKLNENGFEYVSGYLSNKSQMTVRCVRCGTERHVTGDYLGRKPKPHRGTVLKCLVCEETERKARQEQEKAERLEADTKRRLIISFKSRVRKYVAMREKEENRPTVICQYCGKEFKGNSKTKYCSSECSRRYANREHWRERYLKEKAVKIDKGISLYKVYEMAHGICYLCGGMCNWNDYTIENGTVITGNDYPSIEHVIPISKGGTHSWDNVRLAHRLCNTKKGNKVDLPHSTGSA